jgi:hypothetical protein
MGQISRMNENNEKIKKTGLQPSRIIQHLSVREFLIYEITEEIPE